MHGMMDTEKNQNSWGKRMLSGLAKEVQFNL